MTEQEVQLELLKISKANNKKFESIKKNVQLIAWVIIISILTSIFTLIS